jgi:hypothetical protein
MVVNLGFIDLDKIADSGQCFRWEKTGSGSYVIPSGRNTLIVRQAAPDTIEEALYWEKGATEGVEVDGEHSCQQYKAVEKRFSGVFVGTTTLSTELECFYEEPPYGRCGFIFRKSNPQEFAIVYYAANKKRLVPLDSIEEADDVQPET